MAAEGMLTSDVVFGAILENAETLNDRFGETNATFAQLGNQISTSITPLIGELAARARPFVQAFSEFVMNNPQVTAAIAAIGVALGALALVGGPITLVAAALAAVIVFFPEIQMAARVATDFITTASVSYTHLTLPTIYSV